MPRNIANFKAFENAATLDIAMGGSTNTILHLLAAAQGEIDFDLRDIDRLSRHVPACRGRAEHPEVPAYGRRAPCRRDLQHPWLPGPWRPVAHRPATVHSKTMAEGIAKWDITQTTPTRPCIHFFKAGPAGIPTQTAFSQSTRWETLDDDRENGCIRSVEHAYSKEGGLAVLYGNIALDGCVVKTAGVDESIHVFEQRGTARTAPCAASSLTK